MITTSDHEQSWTEPSRSDPDQNCRRAKKMQRDCLRFEQWLEINSEFKLGKATLSSLLCKLFLLHHIPLYPESSAFANEFEGQKRGEPEFGVYIFSTCHKVFGQLISVIRMQLPDPNFVPDVVLMEIIPFFRILVRLRKSKCLYYKKTIHSSTILNLLTDVEVPGPNTARDTTMILLTWAAKCTARELTELCFSDIAARGVQDVAYLKRGSHGITPIPLSPLTLLCILDLLDRNLSGYPIQSDDEKLLQCRHGNGWRALLEHEVEIILERHFRFIAALYGLDYKHARFPELPTSEVSSALDAEARKVLKTFFTAVRSLQSRPLETELEDADWDAAVIAKFGQIKDPQLDPPGNMEQLDWDSAVRNSLNPAKPTGKQS